jgi:hypothetical protein
MEERIRRKPLGVLEVLQVLNEPNTGDDFAFSEKESKGPFFAVSG